MIGRAKRPYLNSFLTACFVALILLSAAVLKWISPPLQDPLFYMIVGGLEALLAVSLLMYHSSWRVWVILALIISSWMGFSIYVTLFGLPCSCMGSSLTFPRGMSLILNAFILLGTWNVLSRQPAHPVRFKRLLWFCILFLIIGFSFSVIYFNYQT